MAEQPFDWFGFQTLLSDIGQLLAELKYVDDAVDFLTSDGQQQPSAMVRHTIGRTEPFDVYSSPRYAGIGEEELGGLDEVQELEHLQELADDAAMWAYGEMPEIRERCDLIVKPVQEDYIEVAEALRDLVETLENSNAAGEGDDNFGLNMSRWSGNAALSFDRGFVEPFSSVRHNHRLALARSAACVASGRAVVIAGQNALMNLMATYKQGLLDQLKQRAQRNRAGTIDGSALVVVGTGLNIIGTLVSATGGGAPVGVAIAATGTGLAYAGSQIPSADSEERTIQVAEAPDVVSDMRQSIAATRATYIQDWMRVGYRLQAVQRDLDEDEADGLLFPPAPSIDGATPEDFHHGSSQQY